MVILSLTCAMCPCLFQVLARLSTFVDTQTNCFQKKNFGKFASYEENQSNLAVGIV